MAEHRLDALQRRLERHHRAARDDVHHRHVARGDGTVGGDQIVQLGLPRRLADHAQALGRAAQEHVATDPIARHQPRAGLAHRVEPLQPKLQPQREFGRIGLDLGIARQQQPRFEIGEPRRHHEIVGRDLELERARIVEEGEILLDQRQDRQFAQIDLLRARQRQQQVERAFPAVDIDGERVVGVHEIRLARMAAPANPSTRSS